MAPVSKQFPALWGSLAQAPVRLVADVDSGWVIAERTDDQHSLSADTLQRVSNLLRDVAPSHVLLLDFQDRVTGVEEVGRFLKSAPRRLAEVHALAVAAGRDSPLFQATRRREIGRGVFEVSLADVGELATPPHDLAGFEDFLRLLEKFTAPSSAPEPVPAQASAVDPLIEARDRLRREVHLIQAEQWRRWSGNQGKNPSAALGKYKADGRLFAVPEGKRYLYPQFQFAEKDARPKAAVAMVLRRVPDAARGWPLLSWFNAPNVLLDDRKPLEILDSDPARVAEAAGRFYDRGD